MGKQAKQAIQSGKLSAFIKKTPEKGAERSLSSYVDWGNIRDNLISGAVSAVNREGGSLLFGHTRDLSSFSIVVFFGGDKTSYYFPDTEQGHYDCEVFLAALCELADTIADAPL